MSCAHVYSQPSRAARVAAVMTMLPMGWMDCESELSGAQVEIANSMAQEKMTVALDGSNSHKQLGMTVFLRSAKIPMEG